MMPSKALASTSSHLGTQRVSVQMASFLNNFACVHSEFVKSAKPKNRTKNCQEIVVSKRHYEELLDKIHMLERTSFILDSGLSVDSLATATKGRNVASKISNIDELNETLREREFYDLKGGDFHQLALRRIELLDASKSYQNAMNWLDEILTSAKQELCSSTLDDSIALEAGVAMLPKTPSAKRRRVIQKRKSSIVSIESLHKPTSSRPRRVAKDRAIRSICVQQALHSESERLSNTLVKVYPKPARSKTKENMEPNGVRQKSKTRAKKDVRPSTDTEDDESESGVPEKLKQFNSMTHVRDKIDAFEKLTASGKKRAEETKLQPSASSSKLTSHSSRLQAIISAATIPNSPDLDSTLTRTPTVATPKPSQPILVSTPDTVIQKLQPSTSQTTSGATSPALLGANRTEVKPNKSSSVQQTSSSIAKVELIRLDMASQPKELVAQADVDEVIFSLEPEKGGDQDCMLGKTDNAVVNAAMTTDDKVKVSTPAYECEEDTPEAATMKRKTRSASETDSAPKKSTTMGLASGSDVPPSTEVFASAILSGPHGEVTGVKRKSSPLSPSDSNNKKQKRSSSGITSPSPQTTEVERDALPSVTVTKNITESQPTGTQAKPPAQPENKTVAQIENEILKKPVVEPEKPQRITRSKMRVKPAPIPVLPTASPESDMEQIEEPPTKSMATSSIETTKAASVSRSAESADSLSSSTQNNSRPDLEAENSVEAKHPPANSIKKGSSKSKRIDILLSSDDDEVFTLPESKPQKPQPAADGASSNQPSEAPSRLASASTVQSQAQAQPQRVTRSKMRQPPPQPPITTVPADTPSEQSDSARKPAPAKPAPSAARSPSRGRAPAKRMPSTDSSSNSLSTLKRKPNMPRSNSATEAKRIRTSSGSSGTISKLTKTLTKASSHSRIQTGSSTPSVPKTTSFLTLGKNRTSRSPISGTPISKTLTSFIKRATPKKQPTREELNVEAEKKYKEKMELEKLRLAQAEKVRLAELEHRKQLREERMLKTKEAREAKRRENEKKQAEMQQKLQHEMALKIQAQEKKKQQDDLEKAAIRDQKLKEAHEKRKRDEQERLQKIKAQEITAAAKQAAEVRKAAQAKQKLEVQEAAAKRAERAEREAASKATEPRAVDKTPIQPVKQVKQKTSIYTKPTSRQDELAEERAKLISTANKLQPTVNLTNNTSVLNRTFDRTFEMPQEDVVNYMNIREMDKDDEFDDKKFKKYTIPQWAQKNSFKMSLVSQHSMLKRNPDHHVHTLGHFAKQPDLTKIFSKHRPRFFKRTSSALWASPPVKYMNK